MLIAVLLLAYVSTASVSVEATDVDMLKNAYTFECGTGIKTLVYNCDLKNETAGDCQNVDTIKSLLKKAKFESHFNLPKGTISSCTYKSINSIRGMKFSNEGVPLTLPTNSSGDSFYVLNKATIYKYSEHSKAKKFIIKGCIFSVEQGQHAFFEPYQNVRPILEKANKPVEGGNVCYDFMAVNKLNYDGIIYEGRHPVILVPGYFASDMFARLNNVAVPDSCLKQTKGYDYKLWFEWSNMIRDSTLDCWTQYIKLSFNESTKRSENYPGVETRVNDWGSTKPVYEFGPIASLDISAPYFKDIVDAAKKWGYKDNVEIRGAPYDFRKAPNEAEAYFSSLKTLVEETYEKNDQRKVVLAAHGMGNLYTLYFLNNMTQEWKDKYIKSYISVAAPWYGAVVAMNFFIDGETADISRWLIEPMDIRPAQRSFPSSTFLMPSKKLFSNGEVLVTMNGKKYSVENYEEFFKDVNFTAGYKMWKETHGLVEELKSPGVEVHCIIAYGEQTPETYDYNFTSVDSYSKARTITYGEGDGLVNLRSANGCLKWQNTLKDKFHNINIKSQHMKILAERKLIDYIRNVISGKTL